MSFRFRKSIKLAPGVRLNFGLRGLSTTIGPRGASVNLSSRGVYQNLGLSGTGLSMRKRLDTPSPRASTRSVSHNIANVAFRLQDDGTVTVVADDGSPLPTRLAKIAGKQNEETWRPWLEEKCGHWNKGIDELLGIHLATPNPHDPPLGSHRAVFTLPQPTEPVPRPITFLARIFASRRERVETQNAEAFAQYKAELAAWERQRAEHDAQETARLALFADSATVTPSQFQDYLCAVLEHVAWPRETTVSLEVDETTTKVSVDVDLPEIEDMPDKTAVIAARGLKLNIKDRSPTQKRREYMTHVHGVVFRVVGETFAALPRIQQVTVSGFSQRPDKTTGQIVDEYLLSVRVPRTGWLALNFSALADIDVPACLGSFDIHRDMTSTGIFRPIEPFSSHESCQ